MPFSHDAIIPPEIKFDPFYRLLQTLAADPAVKTVLEIGSSAGEGSTEALVTGMRVNPSKPQLYCVEISKARFEALRSHWANDTFVHCYNASSVAPTQFESEAEVQRFYQSTRSNLNQYPLEQVLGWRRDDLAYLQAAGVPHDGIELIRRQHAIDRFDMVLIDGSEFTGPAELNLVYGARFILLDDVLTFKNAANFSRLSADPSYLLRQADFGLRNGYAFFERIYRDAPATISLEANERRMIERRVRPGMTVLDVGANVGDYAILFSRLVGAEGKVFAFEPATSTADKLRRRLTDHGCENVRVIQAAAWRENGTIEFNEFAEEFSVWNSIGKPTMLDPVNLRDVVPLKSVETVPARRLDDFAREHGITFIDFLKLDVEGAESDALLGATELLKNKAIGLIQFEISREMLRGMNRSARQVFDILQQHGYTCHTILPGGEVGPRATDSESYYENYLARPEPSPAALPVHFFTIVLNGEPFIRHHFAQFAKLPFDWHWHIVEGVADLKHDTAWSVRQGGRIPPEFHRNGHSIDGTSEYLDELLRDHRDRVTIYRKPPGHAWEGKREMCNAPLTQIAGDCLLFQVDADELWTTEQLTKIRQLFLDQPDKTAAYYYCHFFVGPDRLITTRNGYANNPSQDWLRTWRYRPGMQWAAHEPPVLAEPIGNNQWRDVAAVNPIRHDETDRAGLVFEHHAYATAEQVLFKQSYYGYNEALIGWADLQYETNLPARLGNYFPWVTDNTQVDAAHKYIPNPLMKVPLSPPRSSTAKKPLILLDAVFFQMFMTGIARVWWSLLTEWTQDGFADHILLLDRAGTMPALPGVRRRIIPLHDYRNPDRDRQILQQVCDEEGADLFVSTYYSTPLTTPSALMLYDMIPEVFNYDFNEAMWAQKRAAVEYASSFLAISENTKRDLIKHYPRITADDVTIAYCGVWPVFRPIDPAQVEQFRQRHRIPRPYFLSVGMRDKYKNGGLLFRAYREFPSRDRCQILCVGGHAELEPEFMPLILPQTLQMIPRVADEELACAYAGAVALVYPSRYEGFGLPILEAFACGCPVITSRLGSIPEVAGEAVIYVDPDDPADLARAMEQVLDPQTRARLIQAGFERAKIFSWRKMADTVQQTLRHATANPPGRGKA